MLTLIRSALKSSLVLSTELRGSSCSEMSGRGSGCRALLLLPLPGVLLLGAAAAVLLLTAALLLCLGSRGC